MDVIAGVYSTSSFDTGNNKEKSESQSYIGDDNEQYACDSHAHMFYLF